MTVTGRIKVVLPARYCERGGYQEIHDFCKDLALCSPGHSLFHDKEWFHVYCFSDPAHAERFRVRFGGEKFNPQESGKGNNWARWNKR